MAARHRSAFGSTLRHYREAAGLSQEELAERAGLSVRGISDLERGVRLTPRLETVRMLAAGFGLDESGLAALLRIRNTAPEPGSTVPRIVRARPDLPIPPTSFIGREPEVAAIAGLLREGGVQLLTLVGPGGVGKTRVALEVARRLAVDYADGALLVDLSPVRRAEFVLPALAARLGIPINSRHDLGEVLAVALQERRMLLVLDNLEQVVDAGADIAALLAVCPGLTVLATSRTVLRLAAEHVLPIEPMPLPDEDGVDVSSLATIDSVALFVARARAADGRFALTGANAVAVAAVVHRLDGLPLAIELAAARIRLFSPADLLARLETQLPVLTGGTSDVPDRQRTLRDAIRWSHDLLTAAEQADLRRLAIFPGGCTLEAAESMLAARGDQTDDVTLDRLASLLDSSLLRRREGSDGEMRYVMLEAVREYGLEQLQATGEEDTARNAPHVAWYLPLARRVEFLMLRPDAVTWLNRVGAEYVNLRAHIRWLIGHGRIEDALDISGSLTSFRAIRGHYDEGRREVEMLLSHPASEGDTVARARALVGLGILRAQQADAEPALETLREGAELSRKLGRLDYLALALTTQGLAFIVSGRFDEAEEVTRQGHEIARSIDSRHLISAGMHNLGVMAAQRGHREEARELLEESLALSREIGDTWGVALGELARAGDLMSQGELDQAEACVLDAQQRIQALQGRRDMPGVYELLANIARQRGDLPGAAHTLEEALGVARDIGDSRAIVSGLARITWLQGDRDAALAPCHDAIHWYEHSGDTVSAVHCLDTVADFARMMGHAGQAAWCIGAVDGMLAARGLSRLETAPGEHQARVDAIKAALGEDEWRRHWGRGNATAPEEALLEIRAWRPARPSA